MALSHMLHVYNLQNWVIYGVNVDEYSSTIEHMGLSVSTILIWVVLIISSPQKDMKVSWDYDIPNRWKIKIMFQTTNQWWDYSVGYLTLCAEVNF